MKPSSPIVPGATLPETVQPRWLGGPAEHDAYFVVQGHKLLALHVKGELAWVTHVRAVVVDPCPIAEVDRRTREWITALTKIASDTLPVEIRDVSPERQLRDCESCEENMDCEYREDTGIKPGWLCDECYWDWKAQP